MSFWSFFSGVKQVSPPNKDESNHSLEAKSPQYNYDAVQDELSSILNIDDTPLKIEKLKAFCLAEKNRIKPLENKDGEERDKSSVAPSGFPNSQAYYTARRLLDRLDPNGMEHSLFFERERPGVLEPPSLTRSCSAK